MTNEMDAQKKTAVDLIREAFDIASRMQRADLAAINDPRPPKLRYKSQSELVRDFTHSASVMVDFAVRVGLITSVEATALLRETASEHPDVDEWLMS